MFIADKHVYIFFVYSSPPFVILVSCYKECVAME